MRDSLLHLTMPVVYSSIVFSTIFNFNLKNVIGCKVSRTWFQYLERSNSRCYEKPKPFATYRAVSIVRSLLSLYCGAHAKLNILWLTLSFVGGTRQQAVTHLVPRVFAMRPWERGWQWHALPACHMRRYNRWLQSFTACFTLCKWALAFNRRKVRFVKKPPAPKMI